MSYKTVTILAFSAFIVILVAVYQLFYNTSESGAIFGSGIPEGQRLAEIHCSGCHKFPDPGLLPWKTWRFETLGAMAPFLGIADPSSAGGSPDQRKNPYIPDNIYPDSPRVTPEEWQKIRNYYLENAPQSLAVQARESEIVVDPLFFNARFPSYDSAGQPLVTAVKFDPGNQLIYLGNSGNSAFMVFDSDLEPVSKAGIESPVSDIQFVNSDTSRGIRELILTFIGEMYPSDAPYGSIVRGRYHTESRKTEFGSILSDKIARPVESQIADLNRDGKDDILINEFGHRGGNLFWLENRGEDLEPEKHILHPKPGCIQSHIMDYTSNGLPDVIALCTQTDQSVYLFANRGDSQFEQQTLLQFEVTAGSSSFEIHDFNEDGYPDLLYTAGDNADFSKIFKSYHGVSIYLNDGNGEFQKHWFYPINGAYDAKARDFDGDGNLDLAVISYFADYENNPEEGFVFFKNMGDLMFKAYHPPVASTGRWLTMDVADWTGNGRDDILLGNFSEGPMSPPDHIHDKLKEGPYFLLLENKSQ